MATATCPTCRTRFSPVAGQPIVCPGCGATFKSVKKRVPVAVVAGNGEHVPPSFTQESMPEIVPPEIVPPDVVPPDPVAPPARPSPVFPESFPVEKALPLNSSWQFKPREYPAMRIIVSVFHVFALLTIASFILSAGFALLTMFGMMASANSEAGNTAVIGIMYLAVSLFVHGVFVVIFMAAAESIRVWLDIQANTQETAFYARMRQA